jgi:hypothetical protein
MRTLKLVGATIAALACTTVVTSSASATETLWLWLPGASGTPFIGESAKATLQIKGNGSVTCPNSTAVGELLSEQTLASATLHLGTKGACTLSGLPVNSLGDSSGHVLVHVDIHNCRISTNHLGLLFKISPLHIEVPSTKLLLTIEGSYIAETSLLNIKLETHKLTLEQKEGKQTIEKCEGGSADTLSTSIDGGAFLQTGIEAKEDKIRWTTTEQEAMS